jgi:hypothetical protein
MSEATNPELARAYQLIESDELEEARELLDSYLERERDNPDAWWLYAHAVTEPMEAQDALRNVLRLDPSYPGAKSLLAESEEVLTPKTSTALPRLSPRPVTVEEGERVPDFLDQLDTDDEDFDAFDEDEFSQTEPPEQQRSNGSRRLLFILVPILVAIIVIGVILALINTIQNRPPATPTSVAGVATDATPTAQINVDSTADVVNDGLDTIAEAMSGFTVIENGIAVEQTELGETLMVSICNDPARGLVATTLSALDQLVQQSGITGQAAFIAVQIVDCERDNLPLRTVAVDALDAQAFSTGDISVSEFRSRLRPLNP